MNITQSIQGHIDAQFERNNDTEARVKKHAQAMDYCIKWFESKNIDASKDFDSSVYITVDGNEFHLSSAEVNYRADLYKSSMEES